MMARSKVREEKIFVTVRVRPLNGKEVAQGETADWVCLNEHTVVFKPASGERERPAERSALPSSYVFDRVFGPECATQRVYEDGAKDVSLSALTGLNSTIFAYGQTSSGKTYTMRGIMECAVRDIYEYIRRKEDREFVLKVSAMEIYNEAVRDLLHPEAGSGGGQGLKLLDDPEKGTIVEKIVEEVIQDMDHLRRILAVCEAQRQVGQTSLNDTSSRSHQIIRVSVESFARAGPGEVAPSAAALVASLNFVDLAGSERASQTQAEGARLKEGTYINRSLLTLGTVIRKLSGGNSGHIPYRDSKLTRILQNSLGGNARTAIICTMSPAHSHAEQTRNTLSFATRAKEVTNKAEVNVVISDKLLVKQLQREVARLEAERRTPELAAVSMSTEALLLSKDLEIERMDIELKELQRQRDAARGELEEAKRRLEEDERMALELKQLQQQRDAARGELEVVKRRLEEDERMALELKELQRQRDAAKGELEEVRRRLEEDERMAEEVTKLQRQRDAAQAELEEVKRRLEGDERRVLELEELQRQRDAAQAELKAVSRRVEGAERRVLELEELQRQRDAAQAELEQVRQRLENDERRVLELQRQRDAAQGELEEVKRKVEGGERMVLELKELKRQRDAAQGELEEVRRRMEGELDAVQAELEEVKMKMGGELDEVRSRLEGELDEVRRRLEGELEEVKKKLAEEQEAKKAVQPSEDPVPQADQQLSPQGHVTLADHLSIRQPGLSVRRSESALMLAQEIHKLEHLQDELGEDAGRALEALQKEVECLRLAQSGMNEDAAAAISKLRSEIQSMHSLRTNPSRSEQGSSTLAVTPVSMRKSMQQELSRLQALGEEKYNTEATIATLEAQLENVQISLDKLLMESVPASPVASEDASPAAPSSGTPVKKKKTMPFGVSGNIRYRLLAGSPPCSPGSPGTRRSENNENVPPPSPRTPSNNTRSQGKEGDASKDTQKKKNSVDVRKMQNLFKTAAEENIKSIRAYVSELKERVSKLQYQKQLLMCQVLELEANKSVPGEASPQQQEEEGAVQLLQPAPSPQTLPWHAQYEVQRNLIIELWHICQVSIIHRTQFYLLFRGDPADAIYMEVELRRLTWLHENGSDPCIMNSPNPSFSPSPIKSLFQDEQGTPLSASARSLRRERELLARRMRTRLTMEEKEELYFRWDVPVDSKQRRLQLAQRLWTSCDLDHVQASAEVVARIVGFWEPGNLPSKEMFELNLTHPNQQRQWIVNGLNSLSNLLNL